MSINEAMRTLRVFCLLLLPLLCSCTFLANQLGGMGLFAKKKPKDNRTGEVKVIGVIELVNPEQNYVLINCEQRLAIPPGTEILAQNPDGSKVRLKVSPERKGNYITADITEGVPQVRDLVLYQVKPEELAAAQTPVPGQGPAPASVPVTGPPVQLTPIMKADVIPPLDAPFQPIAPTQPAVAPAVPAPPPAAAPTVPVSPAPAEPAPDLSKLPPVIR